jgi:hypothetical protein
MSKNKGHWCGEGYLSKTSSASEGTLLPVEVKIIIRPRHLIDNLFLLAPTRVWNFKDNFLLIHSLSQQHAIWSKNNLFSYILIPEEKAILTYDVDGTIQLLDMYTGNILGSFNFQGYHSIHHVIGPFCYFYNEKIMLIDVRTGEIMHTLKLHSVIQPHILSTLLPDMEPSNILIIPGPTRIEYVNISLKSALICEYAQI